MLGVRRGSPFTEHKDTILKLAGIANRFWQVVTRGLFSGVYTELQSVQLKSFQFAHILAVHLRSERLSEEKPGLRGFHLPALTLLHFKVSQRTLRSPTLHLWCRIKEIHYALKKLIPQGWQAGCQPRWLWYGYGSVRQVLNNFSLSFFFFFPPTTAFCENGTIRCAIMSQ